MEKKEMIRWVNADERQPDDWDNAPVRYRDSKSLICNGLIWKAHNDHLEMTNESGWGDIPYTKLEWLEELTITTP